MNINDILDESKTNINNVDTKVDVINMLSENLIELYETLIKDLKNHILY